MPPPSAHGRESPPAGIAESGQIGIAGQAKSALVDSGVVEFFAWAELQ